MATVTSLTEQKILELLDGWNGVSQNQEDTNALVIELRQLLESSVSAQNELQNNVLPELKAQLSDNDLRLADLNETTLPDLQAALDDNAARLSDVATVDIPNLQADLASGIENSLTRPQPFFADEPPVDTEDRILQVDDIWYDTNDGNKQYRWNGTEWMTFQVNIADFSLTVRKMLSTNHHIY